MPTKSDTETRDPWGTGAKQEAVEKANSYLAEVAELHLTMGEDPVEWRPKEDKSPKIALPSNPSEMELETARSRIDKLIKDKSETYAFEHTIKARPLDGAFAFSQVLTEVYGMPPVGKKIQSFFGSQPPELKWLQTDIDKQVQVLFGLMEFPPLQATFYLDDGWDDDYGKCLSIQVQAMKKHEPSITGLLVLLERYVREHSVYQNKALMQVESGPTFYDAYKALEDRQTIVFHSDAYNALNNQIWGIIKNTELIRKGNAGYQVVEPSDPPNLDGEGNVIYDKPVFNEDGSPKIEKTHIKIGTNVLLTGDNGSGKSSALKVTAQICLENNWNFVQLHYNEDFTRSLRFIEELHRPTVVAQEDVENLFKNPTKMVGLLEEFDGLRSKGFELMFVMTTNHPEELPKSMMGGHRVDHTILVETLDRPAVERLINKLIPASQREELDYEQLHAAYEGYTPAWIVRSLEDVAKFSLIRTGRLGQPLATPDFVQCAADLRPAKDLHTLATDRPEVPKFEALFRQMFTDVLKQSVVDLEDGEIVVNA